ncbi:hypothetical protein [Cyanobium sp. BA20m-p-22]|nr:hypothetical protein [Cyanobium sp. BA20m-p-22]
MPWLVWGLGYHHRWQFQGERRNGAQPGTAKGRTRMTVGDGIPT